VTYISEAIRQRVIKAARNRCGYCLCQQQYSPVTLEIEHLHPLAKGGTDEESNLCLACRTCNNFKRDQIDAIDAVTGQRVPLFNPRQQHWADHFEWSDSGQHILGKTPIGRATVEALKLNNELMVTVRGLWVQAGWHRPKD
jgi:HNH endonuclease